ncbi:hypothetical protein [Salininema proteolyticum]|uniref:Uncharacterized protein n=1 Tax=Salininema proteolyticum TaxID=1607685 RepID=A0ABV8TV13_9ACTN
MDNEKSSRLLQLIRLVGDMPKELDHSLEEWKAFFGRHPKSRLVTAFVTSVGMWEVLKAVPILLSLL